MKNSNPLMQLILGVIISFSALASDRPYKGPTPNITDNSVKNDIHTSIHCEVVNGGIFSSEKAWYVDISDGGRKNSFSHYLKGTLKWSGQFDKCDISNKGDVSCDGSFYGKFDIKFSSKELWIRKCNFADRLGGCYEKIFVHLTGVAQKQNIKLDCEVGTYEIP